MGSGVFRDVGYPIYFAIFPSPVLSPYSTWVNTIFTYFASSSESLAGRNSIVALVFFGRIQKFHPLILRSPV